MTWAASKQTARTCSIVLSSVHNQLPSQRDGSGGAVRRVWCLWTGDV